MAHDTLTGRGRGLFLSLLLSFFSLGLLIFFTWEEDTLTSLELLNVQGLVLVVMLVATLWLVEGLRVKALLRAVGSTVSLPLWTASRVFLITYFCAGITPWSLGEWPAHILALTRQDVAPGEAAAATLLRSLYTKGVFVLWSGTIIFFFDSMGVKTSTGRIFQGAFYAVAISSFAYFLVILKPGLVLILMDFLSRFPSSRHLYEGNKGITRFLKSLLGEARRFRSSLGRVWRRGPVLLLWPLVLTVLYWSLYFSIAPLILWGFGFSPPYFIAFSWQVMIFLILTYIPLPGGSGAAEFGAASLFVAFVPASVIGIFIAAWRFFTYYMSLLAGGIAFFSSFRKHH